MNQRVANTPVRPRNIQPSSAFFVLLLAVQSVGAPTPGQASSLASPGAAVTAKEQNDVDQLTSPTGEKVCTDPTPRLRSATDVMTNIGAEQPAGVAERVYFHYEDPEIAMRSYSAVDVGGCSGTMIGPNVMMTAGHCGSGAKNATFRLYVTPDVQRTETFSCAHLVHTFSDMDLNLFWCAENADGESPGDKYGYADLDIVVDPATGQLDYSASRNRIANGTDVYSVWMNPITALGGGWHSLYSEGMITDDQLRDHWGNPNAPTDPSFRCGNGCCDTGLACSSNCDGGACGTPCATGQCTRRPSLDLGVRTDVWSNPGASGSSQFNASNHRLLIGPLSTGSTDNRGRNAVGIVDHLYRGFTDSSLTSAGGCLSCAAPQLNEPLLQSMGLSTPADYYGYVDYIDSIEDGLFDVPQELEQLAGENPRPWYWLGFESHRRNAVWTRELAGSVTIDASDAATGIATLDTRSVVQSGYTPVLAHEHLNLPPHRYYDLSITTLVAEGVYAFPVRVCLEGTESDCVDFDPLWSSWQTNVARLWASSGATLRLYVREGTLLHLAAVSLIAHGATMDFDAHDRRFMWRNHNTGGRARVWPHGVDSATQPDWAGVVYRDPNEPFADDWSLRNRQLAIDGNELYRVCFDHRRSGRDPLIAGLGQIRMLNEYGVIPGSTSPIDPLDSWQTSCTSWFHVPTDDNNLQFGVYALTGASTGAYLVDNIRVLSESVFTDGFESGTTSRWSSVLP